MANTCYDNFFLSNEIEDQYQSHLDLQQFCTVDNNLTGVAGMVRKIHKYKATDGTEKLTMGNGNTKTIEAGYTEKEYRIQMAQNRFQYYDEEAMTDPMVITTGTRHAGTDMFNTVNADIFGAFNEATFDTFQDGWAADAFASGAAWGDGVADKVSGMFDFSALDSMGADSLDAFNLGNDLDSIYGNTGDIANNTAATADALDIAEEDLAYLRDIAEREAINRFTTAEIKVEQHNENHISKDADLDGIMDAWANDFAEKLEVSEEGVHE